MKTEAISYDDLKPFAVLTSEAETWQAGRPTAFPSGHHSHGRLDVPAWLNSHGVIFRQKEQPTSDGRAVYLLDTCPFNPEHGQRGEVCVMQSPEGRMSFKCQHDSCSDKRWGDAQRAIGAPASMHYERGSWGTDSNPMKAPRFVSGLMTSREFAARQFDERFLIDGVLVRGQPCVIGGPPKCLKTGILLDMAVSLGSGTPFMGQDQFAVGEVARTCVLSGESGGFKLQTTARRICQARGVDLAEAEILWGFDLPELADPLNQMALRTCIEDHEVDVLIIDPAYLSLMAGDTQNRSPSNVYAMGSILREVGSIGQDTGCTIIFAHHTRKPGMGERYNQTEFDQLTQTGFQEWARQWLLLGRAEKYAGLGHHKLWLDIGGSAGHFGSYVLHVNEGELLQSLWAIQLQDADQFAEDREAHRARTKVERKDRQDATTHERRRSKLKQTMEKFRDGETKSTLREAASLNSGQFDLIIGEFIVDGIAEECSVTKNKREYDGFRLRVPEQSESGTGRDSE